MMPRRREIEYRQWYRYLYNLVDPSKRGSLQLAHAGKIELRCPKLLHILEASRTSNHIQSPLSIKMSAATVVELKEVPMDWFIRYSE